FPTNVLNGAITLKNAKGRWLNLQSGVGPRGEVPPPLEGQEFVFDKAIVSVGPRQLLLAINRKDAENAELEINLHHIYHGTIRVRECLQKQIYGIGGLKGFNMVLSHYLSQSSLPDTLQLNEVRFSNISSLPDLPYSILKLRAVGISAHVHRSAPFVPENAN